MPRPSKSSSKAGTSGGSVSSGGSILKNNPFTAWLQNRKNIKAQKMEEAAKQVSNNKAENEMKISNILNSINFTESLLPVEKLDYKSNDSQPYGDLEFAVVVASDLISSNTYDYSGVDISNIDASIVVIAQELKNAIETGDVNRAFSAKSGLVVAVNDVRNKIPFVPEDMKKAFVESCESYLELWKTLIMSCTSLDALQKNLDSQIANIEKKKKKYSEDNKAVAKRLIEEPELQQKIESISNETFISNGQRWDQESLDFYKFLVNQRIEKSALTFELLQHDMLEKQMAYQSKIINDYRTRVENNPVPEDPNLLNKYKDMMEQEFKRAAEIDAQFDELGEYMDSMDERINQMAYSKGSIRQKRMAQASVDSIVELAKQIQLEEAGLNENGDQMNALRRVKLLSESEIQKIKEEQAQQVVQPVVNVNKNQNRTRNTN